jgi:hypothetical protein
MDLGNVLQQFGGSAAVSDDKFGEVLDQNGIADLGQTLGAHDNFLPRGRAVFERAGNNPARLEGLPIVIRVFSAHGDAGTAHNARGHERCL